MKFPKIGWFTPQEKEIRRAIANQPGMSLQKKRDTAQRIIEDEEIDSLKFNEWNNASQRFMWTIVGCLLFAILVYASVSPQGRQIWPLIGLILALPLIYYLLFRK